MIIRVHKIVVSGTLWLECGRSYTLNGVRYATVTTIKRSAVMPIERSEKYLRKNLFIGLFLAAALALMIHIAVQCKGSGILQAQLAAVMIVIWTPPDGKNYLM